MRLFLVLLLIICSGHGLAQHQVTSPDQSIQVSVTGGTSLFISALQRGDAIINASEIGMIVRGIKTDSRIRKATRIQHDGIIHPPVAEKRKTIRDHFNEMILSFRSGMSLQVRVYDDGFAYRFLSNIRDSIIIEREIARYSIDPSTTFYGPAVTPRKRRRYIPYQL